MTLWLSNPLGRPHRALSSIFIVWKAVLLLIAILSPGPGYDPSTQQLFTIFQRDSPTPFPQNPSFFTHPVTHIALKLSRWDVIHFLSVARRGYVYEQDWAWGWGWLRLIHWVSLSFSPGPNSSLVLEAMVGIVLVHIAHYASVFVLYHLTLRLTPTTLSSTDKQRIAFTAAFLHTLAPAGLFLSAPYGEALTSFLTFAGTLLYTHDTPLTTILAGTLFALASTVRSNALLNGLFFLHDVLARHLPTLLTTYRRSHTLHPPTLLRLTASLTAGTLLALAFATPQAIAYRTICTPFAPHARQPWCHHFPPSIYTRRWQRRRRGRRAAARGATAQDHRGAAAAAGAAGGHELPRADHHARCDGVSAAVHLAGPAHTRRRQWPGRGGGAGAADWRQARTGVACRREVHGHLCHGAGCAVCRVLATCVVLRQREGNIVRIEA
ncbi:hypothetical protein FH972_021072 [Carpinus fangiana]|uniref:GPI mannosyltransferase 2 n=1 Tax=Carpinus fangiana TaxID=176857 RepID=A0A5N6KNN1_9ROSI|nr:hypothetical protein FH972_021072 [Carpinus fangiana]